jgi:hypothetical protein
MADLISWPIGPVEGDEYSVNGKFWIYNGCAWISTCCPGVCSIYNTGIVVGITQIEAPWGPLNVKKDITTQICFSYDEQSGTWNSESVNDNGDYYQITSDNDEPEGWVINYMQLGLVKLALGKLVAETPIGEWTIEGESNLDKIESICGCPSIICGCGFTAEGQDPNNIICDRNVTLIPVSDDGVSGSIIGYVDVENNYYIYYNTTSSTWEFYMYGVSTPSYTLSLPITTIPIGVWIEGPEPDEFNQAFPDFTTSLGHCHPCNEYTDGIILAYTDEGITTYVPLTWDSATERFENFDSTIYIYWNAATERWVLWINGALAYQHKGELLGYWEKPYTILCGNTSITNTEGCLVAEIEGGNPVTLYLQENTEGNFNYGYPFTGPTWQIVCESGVWKILRWQNDFGGGYWVTEATATASCDNPPYSLTWTVGEESGYTSFTFTEGPCPIVCNSYKFSSRKGRISVSFKLCGCSQRVDLFVDNELSEIFCVQENSINLGVFGEKLLISAPCTPNPTQCYTMAIFNPNDDSIDVDYLDCDGDPITVTIERDGKLTICGRPCSIQTSGRSKIQILGLGCLL